MSWLYVNSFVMDIRVTIRKGQGSNLFMWTFNNLRYRLHYLEFDHLEIMT